MKLIGVMLGSENPKGLKDFYDKAFGKTAWEDGDWFAYEVNGGVLMVGPHSEVHNKSQEPARMMISLQSEDVKTDFNKFKECGASVVAEPYQPDQTNSPDIWLATLADPDGNYLQLASPWEA